MSDFCIVAESEFDPCEKICPESNFGFESLKFEDLVNTEAMSQFIDEQAVTHTPDIQEEYHHFKDEHDFIADFENE